MRLRSIDNGMTVNVIAGTYVVFFGLDIAEERRHDFRGFGFKRFDHVEGETIWMRGMKTFQKTEPHPTLGVTYSTHCHPIQSFQWADYSAEPGRTYTYTVVALYGDPANLDQRIELAVQIATEVEMGPVHSAFFNRGSVATQEYARRFQNKPPSTIGPAAYEWLSRGLLKALITFLDRATTGWTIHGAVYEFQWPEALAAIKRAHQRGADVNVLFDNIEAYGKGGNPEGPWKKNQEAIIQIGIEQLCKGREHGHLMHNKFFVLSQNGQPKAVWTGSTNLTENGIFGHSNVGHIIEDNKIAQTFLDYWQRLDQDPKIDASYQKANVTASPTPPAPWNSETVSVFSPRGKNLDALDWYAQLAEAAQHGLFMTFPFGMNDKFKEVYRKDDSVLRMALLERDWSNPKKIKQEQKDIQEIRDRSNVVIALGNRIVTNSFDRWLAELSKINPNVHVYWIHTKYMLVDPLSSTPTVVTGSANFSETSTTSNDENMLVIRGNKRIADIYFGEFLRLYNHFAFRQAVKWYMDKMERGTPDSWQPQFLVDHDTWMAPYFDEADTSARYARRVYFSGPIVQ